MMTCDDAKQVLVELVFAEPDEEQAILAQQHLAGCSACRDEEQRLLRLRESLQAMPLEPSAELRRRIRIALPRRRQRGLAGLLRLPVPAYLAAAACLAAVLVAVLVARSVPERGTPAQAPRPAATVVDKAPAMFATAGSYETAVIGDRPAGEGETRPMDGQ
jgi:anti-sigma factor RsiW